MSKIISKPSLNKKGILLTFLILCSLFLSVHAFSLKHWNRNLMKVTYDAKQKAVEMNFEYHEYKYSCTCMPPTERAYLEQCDFEYSTDNVNYTHLMTASASANYDWLNMTNKLTSTALQFIGCYNPSSETWWADNTNNVKIFVYDNYRNQAWITIKWFLGQTAQNVDAMFIRINGKWAMTGHNPDSIKNEVYKVFTPLNSELKTEVITDSIQNKINEAGLKYHDNTVVRVFTEADGVVINGVVTGDNIKIYTISGLRVLTTTANNDVVKIKLPTKQVYVVQIGQARYKVAL